mmetsp:Transcript_41428/g.81219  ORF Transcript_41428/g.81219 Transcript_41428/m.81219 type:complete len:89 (-) Transcript_41428:1603-1869(-)
MEIFINFTNIANLLFIWVKVQNTHGFELKRVPHKYKAGLFAAAKLFLPDSKLRFLQESSTKDLRYKNKPAPRPVMCTLLQKLNGQAEF